MLSKLLDEPYWEELEEVVAQIVATLPKELNRSLLSNEPRGLDGYVLNSMAHIYFSTLELGIGKYAWKNGFENILIRYLSDHSLEDLQKLVKDNLSEFHYTIGTYAMSGFYAAKTSTGRELSRNFHGFHEEVKMSREFVKSEMNVQSLLDHVTLEILFNTELYGD